MYGTDLYITIVCVAGARKEKGDFPSPFLFLAPATQANITTALENLTGQQNFNNTKLLLKLLRRLIQKFF